VPTIQGDAVDGGHGAKGAFAHPTKQKTEIIFRRPGVRRDDEKELSLRGASAPRNPTYPFTGT
jgi:hypothetical protein